MFLYADNGRENGNYYSISGLYRDNGKEKMDTTTVYWGYTGIMEKIMETTIMGLYIGFTVQGWEFSV